MIDTQEPIILFNKAYIIYVILFLVLFVTLSFYSVDIINVGEINSTSFTKNAIEEYCPNNYLDACDCCNYLTLYCERYWFPIHSYIHTGAFESELRFK